MVDLEDGFRRVLVAEHHIGVRVLAKVAIDIFEVLAGIDYIVPVLVPGSHLGNHHPSHSCTAVVHFLIVGTHLGKGRNIGLELFDEGVAGFDRAHASHLRDAEHVLVGLDIIFIEGNVAEEAGKNVVVVRKKYPCLGFEGSFYIFSWNAVPTAGAILDGIIPLLFE